MCEPCWWTHHTNTMLTHTHNRFMRFTVRVDIEVRNRFVNQLFQRVEWMHTLHWVCCIQFDAINGLRNRFALIAWIRDAVRCENVNSFICCGKFISHMIVIYAFVSMLNSLNVQISTTIYICSWFYVRNNHSTELFSIETRSCWNKNMFIYFDVECIYCL